jgi:hypothetical protein
MKFKKQLLTYSISIGIGIVSSNALAKSVIPSDFQRNVVETEDTTTIHKVPIVGPVQPLRMQPVPTVQTGQSNASRVLGGQALQMYEQYVVPNVSGMPSYFASLLAAIIQERNPTWNPSLDEGQGKQGYGHGLALITAHTGTYYGVTTQQLYDTNTNIKIALQILNKAQQKFGNNINQIVAWYILDDPNATDSRVQKVLELFKQLEGK